MPSQKTILLLLPFFLVLPGFRASDAAGAPPPPAPAFQPPGMEIWDNWFAHDGREWHAFYLQVPKAIGRERRWKDNDLFKHVGHATSPDLFHWKDEGPALFALPGTWNDRHIATGSVVRHEGQWWMLYTARGTQGDGLGLAVSPDLTSWTSATDKALFPLTGTFGDGRDIPAFESSWQGRPVRWVGISDPYVLPEAVEGWRHLVLCARIVGEPLETGGCLTLLRSRDLRQWEAAGVLAWPGCFERMETPQLWQKNGRWRLSFGGVLNRPWAERNQDALPAPVRGRASHQNYVYSMNRFDEVPAASSLCHVEAPKGHYIMKVLPGAAGGDDVALFTHTTDQGSALSAPWKVVYPAGGGLKLEPLMSR